MTDVEQVWTNCLTYNPPENAICDWANELSALFNELLLRAEEGQLIKSKEHDEINGIELKRKYTRRSDGGGSTHKRKKLDEGEGMETEDDETDIKGQRFVGSKKAEAKQETAGRGRRKSLDEEELKRAQSGRHWEEMFGELKAFKRDNGHCKVPEAFEDNPRLGWWVRSMREANRLGKLDKDKAKKLNSIGFGWDPEGEWEDMFEQFKKYKEKHKTGVIPKTDKRK